jgi:hypothetical protein
MRQFQQLMAQFLQTQALVMTAYLEGNGRAPAASADMFALAPTIAASALAAPPLAPAPPAAPVYVAPPQPPPVAVVPQQAPAPRMAPAQGGSLGARVVMPPPAVPSAVGLAIEPLDVVALSTNGAKATNGDGHHGVNGASRNGAPAPTRFADVLKEVVQIVSDRTGYPEDMLNVDSNIEADLGIDSIKRMEILTAFQQMHGGASASSLQGSLERLTAQKTLRETATLLTELLAPQAAVVS